MSFRSKVAKLVLAHPELRKDIIPLLRKSQQVEQKPSFIEYSKELAGLFKRFKRDLKVRKIKQTYSGTGSAAGNRMIWLSGFGEASGYIELSINPRGVRVSDFRHPVHDRDIFTPAPVRYNNRPARKVYEDLVHSLKKWLEA